MGIPEESLGHVACRCLDRDPYYGEMLMAKDVYGRGKTKFFRWVDGRQGGGYKIMYFWSRLFDLVFIRYPVGSYINWHTDPVPEGLKHYRLNIIVRNGEGGEFHCRTKSLDPGGEDGLFWKFNRLVLFRPDIQPHRVAKISAGERWVVSIGWTRKVAQNWWNEFS